MKGFLKNLTLFFKLGPWKVAYVLFYRGIKNTYLFEKRFQKRIFVSNQNTFNSTNFNQIIPTVSEKSITEDAEKTLKGELRYYSFHWKKIGNPPDWFVNPFNGRRYPNSNLHWTKLSDFDPAIGDIKNIWEPSRFEWVVTLARAYAISGNDNYLITINEWLKDWSEKNPLNTGPNWKCGQEASIRVFNLLNAALILGQWQKPTAALSEFICLHLDRISGNIRYAIAQDNNHGTSEAAALFIGGYWLKKTNPNSFVRAEKFATKGRYWLENRVKKLVAQDGSFSQHSTNYHRVMLDTLCFAEYWQKKLEVPDFSAHFYEKARRSSKWLWQLTDEISGEAPNLGANDGALFLNMHSCDYRDFRPSIQLAHILFEKKRVFDLGPWNEPLFWLGLVPESYPLSEKKRESTILDKAYCVIKNKNSWALIRLPKYNFRPTQNDVFHFDLWVNGENALCDSGSFSYNPDERNKEIDLRSVHSHNTLSFDHEEQMPRISRFLLGGWINPLFIDQLVISTPESGSWVGAYKNYRGNTHQRKVIWDNNSWQIIDRFKGKAKIVEIGFNFFAEEYFFNKALQVIKLPWGDITIIGNAEIRIVEGFVSKYYYQLTPIKRLLIKSKNNSEIRTKICLC